MIDLERTSLGTVVVNEVILHITGCRLERGLLLLEASAAGPNPGFAGGLADIELFGTDGTACGSVRVECPPWHETNAEAYLHCELPLHLAELSAT